MTADFFEMNIISLFEIYKQSNTDNITEIKANIHQIIKDYDEKTEKYKSCDIKYLIEKIDLEVLNNAYKCLECGYRTDNYIQELSDEKIAVVLVSMLDFLKKMYEEKNIDIAVFYQTISDLIFRISDYKNRNNKFGLEGFEGKWLLRIFYMNIFKLGSLQFEISNLQEENIDINSDDLGDCADVLDNDVIMVHIMENEDISYESCVKSLGLADEFFSNEYKCYACYSWLLYENMKKILKPSSKILQFQSIFEKIINFDSSDMAKERVYKNYDENNPTSLQKSMIIHPECMGVGFGIKARN